MDSPVVYYADLDSADAQHARANAGRLAEELGVLTGWTLERRAEGLALIGTTGTFPRPGIVGTLALAIAGALSEAYGDAVPWPAHAEEQADMIARLDDAGNRPPSPSHMSADGPVAKAVPRTWVLDLVADLVAENGQGLSADHRADPGALATGALELLARCDLVRLRPGTVIAVPAVTRYRGATITRSQPARVALVDDAPPDLFGGSE